MDFICYCLPPVFFVAGVVFKVLPFNFEILVRKLNSKICIAFLKKKYVLKVAYKFNSKMLKVDKPDLSSDLIVKDTHTWTF